MHVALHTSQHSDNVKDSGIDQVRGGTPEIKQLTPKIQFLPGYIWILIISLLKSGLVETGPTGPVATAMYYSK